MVTNALNFSAVAVYLRLRGVLGVREAFATVYRTLLPFEFATALLTAGAAFTYERIGIAALILLLVVLGVFHHLARTAVAAHDRGEELMQRTEELGMLQVGVLTTVLQTLAMRDAMTARHSAAVARYSREVARLLGCDEREQDLIHTAALLHDIGKFILPDSVLFANRRLTDDEWELVKLHPESGAKLVERIDGYGPVAPIILHHHERFEGGGYPAGIEGEEIPLGSRIIACADTYDVMTSRDSYRRPVSREAAIAELQRVSGTQLDPRVAAAFEQMIVSGAVDFSHADETDFEPSWTPVRSSAPGDLPRTRVSSTPSRRAATRRSEVSRPSVTRRSGAPTSSPCSAFASSPPSSPPPCWRSASRSAPRWPKARARRTSPARRTTRPRPLSPRRRRKEVTNGCRSVTAGPSMIEGCASPPPEIDGQLAHPRLI